MISCRKIIFLVPFTFFLTAILLSTPPRAVAQVYLTEEEMELIDVPDTTDTQDTVLPVVLDLPDTPSAIPGKTTRVVDPYRSNVPNALYLTSLPRKLWWNEKAEARVHVLVTEPVGLTRINQPASVTTTYPPGTDPASLKVVTPYGRAIHSQSRVINADTGEMETVFVLDRLNAMEQTSLFIYYSKEPFTSEPPRGRRDLCLRIDEREKGIALINNRLELELSKTTSTDRYPIWRKIQGHGMEFNLGRFSVSYHLVNHGVPQGAKLEIIEDGPVRKTLGYGDNGRYYTVSLYANSPLVFIKSASGIQSFGAWLPGGDTLNDVICYASTEGLKRQPINYTGGNTAPTHLNDFLKWFSEGWFALLDEKRHSGVGWFYDHESARRVSMLVLSEGYRVTVNAPGHAAIYVATDSTTESVRNHYIAWKNPPVVSIGPTQPFEKIEPKTPMLGEDFIRMHIMRQKGRQREDEHSASRHVEETLAQGGNYLMFCATWDEGYFTYLRSSTEPDGEPGPAYFDELVSACRAHGVGMCHGLRSQLNPRAIRDIVGRGADAIWLADEWGWRPGGYYPLNEEQRKIFIEGNWNWSHREFSEEERADFKKRYGIEMPDTYEKGDELDEILKEIEKIEPADQGLMQPKIEKKSPFANLPASNFDNPAERAMFRMRIDAHNMLMSDLADIARENNPRVFVSATTSPNNLSLTRDKGAFHDLETHADAFTSVVMDLYSSTPSHLKSSIKYSRGMQSNRRPLFIIGGYCGWDNARAVENNLTFQIMFGANSLAYFTIERVTPWAAMGANKVFNMLDYTGFEDFVAKAWPMEFVGVLRDQNEFFAALERDGMSGTSYQASINNCIIALGHQIPANIISAKRLADEIELPYKVIIVPNNPGISDANTKLLRDFVKAGGTLIMEAATAQNKQMAELAGVTPAGDLQETAFEIKGTKPPLIDWSAELPPSIRQPVTLENEVETLAVIDDSRPGITVMRRGNGKVIYISPRILGVGGQVAPMLRQLVEHATGYIPVKIKTAEGGRAFSQVLTDGERYAICVYNDSTPTLLFSLITEGLPEFKTLTSIRTGVSYRVENGAAHNLSLESGLVDFFVTDLPPTPFIRASAPGISGSLRPGMTFLDLPAISEKK